MDIKINSMIGLRKAQYISFESLILHSNIVEVLNTWRKGAGDKLRDSRIGINILCSPLYRGHDENPIKDTLRLQNRVVLCYNGQLVTTVIITDTDKRNFSMGDYVNNDRPVHSGLDDKESINCVSLDEFIDDPNLLAYFGGDMSIG